MLDASVQALFSDFQKPFQFGRDLPDRYGHGGVAVIAVVDDSKVEANHVAELQDSFCRWDAMNHFFIDGDAHARRKTPIALERRLGFFLERQVFSDSIDFSSRRTLSNVFPQFQQDLSNNLAGALHDFNFSSAL